jgi:hypothetical protein
MRPGLLREAAEFLAGCEELAASLPLHLASEAVAAALSELVVSGAEKRPAFESLEARLRLRSLEVRASALLQAMRRAEEQGDLDALRHLQREKMAVDREATQSRRRVGT